MQNPTEIDFTDYFLGSRWRKMEAELVAQAIVELAMEAGDWVWFSKEGLMEASQRLTKYPLTRWDMNWFDDVVCCGNFLHENGAYFPTERFLSAGRTGGNRNWQDEDESRGITQFRTGEFIRHSHGGR